jgi:hypothetical protein
MSEKASLFNRDGTINYYALEEGHRKAYKKICKETDQELSNYGNETIRLPIRKDTEIEFYEDGSIKRYKY